MILCEINESMCNYSNYSNPCACIAFKKPEICSCWNSSILGLKCGVSGLKYDFCCGAAETTFIWSCRSWLACAIRSCLLALCEGMNNKIIRVWKNLTILLLSNFIYHSQPNKWTHYQNPRNHTHRCGFQKLIINEWNIYKYSNERSSARIVYI